MGRAPGIYYTWDDCKMQTSGFSGAVYKKFDSLEEANDYMNIGATNKEKNTFEDLAELEECDFISESLLHPSTLYAFIDGSYLDGTGYACGVLSFFNGKKECYSSAANDESLKSMRNVAGELMAAKYAIDLAIYNGAQDVVLYYDYSGIEHWATKEWNAKSDGTKEYIDFINGVKDLVNIHFCKIKGHSGVSLNNAVDELAKSALGI